MKKLYSILTASLFILTACGGNGEPVTESLLWKVTGNGLESPSYLLGTHHLGNTEILDDYPSHKKAIGSSGQVVGELVMDEMAQAQMAMMEYATMPEGVTYHDLLSEENYEKLDDFLTTNFGAGLDHFGNFKPMMISTMYMQMLYMASDPTYNPMSHEAIDTYVQRLGREDGKKVLGLETFEEQLEIMFNTEPLESQAQSLLCTLENDDMGMDFVKKLNELYRQGALQEMYDMSFNNPDDPCPSSEEFQLALINRRNENWLAALPAIMSESPSFIAVGALHLAGEPGLVNRLREMGYTVEAIK